MSTGAVFPERYEAQLQTKAEQLDELLQPLERPPLELYRSALKHFRMRAEFRMWREDGELHYVMFDQASKKRVILDHYPMGSEAIDKLMMPLLAAIKEVDVLHQRLFQIEFLSAQTGEMLVSLLYHKPLNEAWEKAARTLKEKLGINLIGRSRKQKICLDQDYIIEKLQVAGREFTYQQVENSFTQPNAGACEQMLSWALESAKEHCRGDLIELYCGNGNFTCVLATHFDKVLATEISKTSVASARYNFAANGIDNVEVARLSAEEFTQALNRERPFRRLSHIDLESYELNTIFVDPPRAGLDKETEKLVQRFDKILYISCNPVTLRENLETLCKTHKIERCALFDQFPYTDHMECGVLLSRK